MASPTPQAAPTGKNAADVLKNAKLRLSRRDRLRKNPIPWILILGVVAFFSFFYNLPMYEQWKQKKADVSLWSPQMEELQNTNDILKRRLQEKTVEFDRKSKDLAQREIQIFPKEIDTKKIIRVLELYALTLEILDSPSRDSKFLLESVAFNGTTKYQMFQAEQVRLNFTSDWENLREFITFLQTRKLSDRFTLGKQYGFVDQSVYAYLENNLLPMTRILDISFDEDTDKDSGLPVLKVAMRIELFYQR